MRKSKVQHSVQNVLLFMYIKKREVNKCILSSYFQERTMEKKTDTGEFLPGKEGNKVEENKIELDFSQFHLVLFGST